jgi:signal transduction histidine kinase
MAAEEAEEPLEPEEAGGRDGESRWRLTRELHEEAQAHLLALRRGLAKLSEPEAGQSGEALAEARTSLREAVRDARVGAFLARPPNLAGRDLAGAAQRLVRGFAQRSGVAATFRTEGKLALDEPSAEAVLDLLREALADIYRRRKGAKLTVVLLASVGQLVLSLGAPSRLRVVVAIPT